MTKGLLKIKLTHILSSNLDMMKLYNIPMLHRECFYKAIEHNTDIVTFLKDLGFNVYNIRVYKSRNKKGAIPQEKKKRTRYSEFYRERENMLYVQRRHT